MRARRNHKRREVPILRVPAFVRFCISVMLTGFLQLTNFAVQMAPAQNTGTDLVSVDQIRHLSRELARQHLKVHLHGVVLNDVPFPDFVLKDQTGSVYVVGSPDAVSTKRLGDVVDLDGITDEGFAPIVHETGSRVVGRSALPTSKLYTVGALLSGQLDSQWVSTRGVVHSATVDRSSWREAVLNLNVVGDGGRFEVRVPLLGESVDPAAYVDREVLVEGVCGSFSNASHQFIGVLFYVPRLRFLKLLGKVDSVPIESLLQFSPEMRSGERTTVKGVVTYWKPGDVLFLQNGKSGLRVQTQQTTPLHPGDVVQVAGFPKMGESKPILQDALLTLLDHQALPAPVELTITPPFERFDGVMISVSTTLLHKSEMNGTINLLLESGGFPFSAVIQNVDDTQFIKRLEDGSKLSIRGICLVRNGGLWQTPESFTILVPSTADVAIIARAPWWNVRHTSWIIGVVLTAFMAVSIWILSLRGRLHRLVELYKHKLSSGAVLEERARIARELHDSLEQDLAGIILQLDLAADYFEQSKEVSRTALNTARTLSRRGMLGARRSVWDMRCQALEEGDLVYALREMVESLNERNQGQVVFSFSGDKIRLRRSDELHLLRIAQEATGNSLKHAQASQIELELQQSATCLYLRISDDGCGFDPNSDCSPGHFGLLDIKERASAMGGRLEIVSNPGSGTRIEVVTSTVAA